MLNTFFFKLREKYLFLTEKIKFDSNNKLFECFIFYFCSVKSESFVVQMVLSKA